MKLEPIARQSLVDMVAQRIRSLIDQGSLEAGARLPGELELVEQLQVSRPVLREAISRLESVGLVTVRRGQGMFVGDRGSLRNCVQLLRSALAIAPKDAAAFTELRTALEVHAARRATELATPADVAELEGLCELMDREDQEHLEAIRYDFQFHRKLVDMVGNEAMSNVMEVIHEYVMAGMFHTTPKPRNRAQSRTLHSAILNAVRAGDPDAAEQAMRVHMGKVGEALTRAEQRRRTGEKS
jgi:GntR family transcriptional repressor for pyruvate dehydrogenase complex